MRSRSHNPVFLVRKLRNMVFPYTLLYLPLTPAVNERSLYRGGIKRQAYTTAGSDRILTLRISS